MALPHMYTHKYPYIDYAVWTNLHGDDLTSTHGERVEAEVCTGSFEYFDSVVQFLQERVPWFWRLSVR